MGLTEEEIREICDKNGLKLTDEQIRRLAAGAPLGLTDAEIKKLIKGSKRGKKHRGDHGSDDDMANVGKPQFGNNALTDEEIARIRAENPELADELTDERNRLLAG